jgi:hypothetical protein
MVKITGRIPSFLLRILETNNLQFIGSYRKGSQDLCHKWFSRGRRKFGVCVNEILFLPLNFILKTIVIF